MEAEPRLVRFIITQPGPLAGFRPSTPKIDESAARAGETQRDSPASVGHVPASADEHLIEFRRERDCTNANLLPADEATRLANACNPHEEKLVVWVLLDTGLRVSELANLKRANLDWQTHRLMIYGKGGPFGTKSKRRVIPLTARIQPLIEGYFALHETFGFTARTIQRNALLQTSLGRLGRAAADPAVAGGSDITKVDLQVHLDELAEDFSKSVVQEVRTWTKGGLEKAVEQDYLSKNPARKLTMPDTQPICKRFLLFEEYQRLLTELE